jgi:hypothetical protein
MAPTTSVDSFRWYVDSGCTKHMTNSKEYFELYVDISYKKRIVEGVGGIVLQVIGVGSISIKVNLGDRSELATLTKVLFVPNLGTSLFSSQRVAQKNVDTITSKSTCRLITQEGEIVMKGVLTSKLYKLDIEPLKPANHTALHVGSFGIPTKKEGLQILDVWHKRFGHLHHEMIKKMVRENTVDGLALLGRPAKQEFCTGCAYGKNH